LIARQGLAKAATFRQAIVAERRRVCLNRSNRERPVPRLLSPCYLPVPSLLSANNLPVIFPFRERSRAAPYFCNDMKRNIFFRPTDAKSALETGRKAA
jgi:hypothetical protein